MWQHIVSEQIRLWNTLACWEIKQPTKQQPPPPLPPPLLHLRLLHPHPSTQSHTEIPTLCVTRSFSCTSEPHDCEQELLDLVALCRRVQHVRFHGVITDGGVIRLAGEGGRRWGRFSFLWKNITKTQQRPTPFNLVSAISQGGQDQGASPRVLKTEAEVKTEFCRRVSEKLGFPWEPLLVP